MKRLTTDNPKDNIENALNLFYGKDGWTWVRGGGPAPDYADISLCDFVRMLVKANIPDAELPEDNDDLSDLMCDWLIDDPDSAEGIISLLYTAGWAFAELRHRLAAYEDTGLEPEAIVDRLAKDKVAGIFEAKTEKALDELMKYQEAKQAGRLVVLPCKVGDWVYALWDVPTAAKYVIYCAEVKEIRISNRNCRLTTTYLLEPIGYRGRRKEYRDDDFGKTVFLTREEAERALAQQ